MKSKIYVTLKNGVLDPQGKAIHHALESMGFKGVKEVRVGKYFEIESDSDLNKTELESMADKLLANTVIENYKVEV
ncbi:MAG: phosphoribosylformylglycinamidine synthase subunit PurS [Deltaproteobacteria bacterium]|nr:phosphoribosylformylglycinamidine synthase subunit PurS [Deltaproteobacteria bacterium]